MFLGKAITTEGVSAYVTGAPTRPGIILLQEWWGVTDQLKRLSDRFAEAGFSVAAPDLYHGKVAKNASEANHLMSGLDFKAAVAECEVWLKYLTSEMQAPAVGVTGFCMGGALTIACASALGSKVKGGSVFYGIPDLTYFPTSSIVCPLLLNFGGKDQHKGFSDPETFQNLVASLKKDGKTFETNVYPDCDHAFMNETRPEVYNEKAAMDAFNKTVLFFKNQLK